MSNGIPLLSMNKAGELQIMKYVLDQLLKKLMVKCNSYNLYCKILIYKSIKQWN